jgi:hypothetical protein
LTHQPHRGNGWNFWLSDKIKKWFCHRAVFRDGSVVNPFYILIIKVVVVFVSRLPCGLTVQVSVIHSSGLWMING